MFLPVCILLVLADGLVSDPVRTASAPTALVLTQLPVRPVAGGPIRAAIGPQWEGAQIAVLVPEKSRRVLTSGFLAARDPEVSFDGERVLFSGKRTATSHWEIYEVGLDGSGLRQITKDMGDCHAPLYLSTLYTLISEKPWHSIAFLSSRTAGPDPASQPPASLYSCRPDGTGLLRLTYNPAGVTDPFLMEDGRILLSAWRRHAFDRPARLSLFGINLDGTDYALFADAEGQPVKRMACATAGGLVVFVEPDAARPEGAGTLSGVSLRRNLHSYRMITRTGDGFFYSPSPLPDGKILVSRLPAEGNGSFAVYELDPLSGTAGPVFDDPAFDDLQARLVAPRAQPDGRSTSVFRRTGEIEDPDALKAEGERRRGEKAPSGRLYCLNVYTSDLLRPGWMQAGTVKRVRVLEGIPPREEVVADRGRAQFPPGARSLAPFPSLPTDPVGRRFLGDVPVEDDGSFHIEVPAGIPIELQTLDSDGLALQTCGWIWVQNNESRGCIGCHEDGELVPENRLVKAVAQPAIDLTLPPDRRRSVDFLRDVMPVIRTRCAACHGDGGSLPQLDRAGAMGLEERSRALEAYQALVAANPAGHETVAPGRTYVTPGSARTSPVIWHLFGRNTSRAWDGPARPRAAAGMPAGIQPLTRDEKRIFIEWIDTGAHWKESEGMEQSKAQEKREE